MSLELKVKSKHLGEEARIIRFEERKLEKQMAYHAKTEGRSGYWDKEAGHWVTTPFGKVSSQHWKLRDHRITDVRNENRATFLARAYLKGQPYSLVERDPKDEDKIAKRNAKLNVLILPRVLKMVQKYGKPKATMKDIKFWVSAT